ncbi:MAG: hypothetical protein BroJett011_42240 [Chloroflexota bacterium]|nr:MAG: hypothetical protein BroJett011_42240 [Chloroflexota bacterium]
MEIIKSANLALRFLLELCILVTLGYWGFKTGLGWAVKIGLGIGGPLLVAVVWGIFLAPNSSMRLQEPFLLILELVIFGLAIAALFATGHRSLAWAFGLIYVINKILMIIWKQ